MLPEHRLTACCRRQAVLWLALLALAGPAPAGILDSLKDPEDGRLDLSEWLLERKGALLVPFFITEPAVGNGGGLGAVFFRQAGQQPDEAAPTRGGPRTPPDIYFLGGAGTENGTKAAAAGGLVTFDQDRYRWRGVVGRVSLNLDFFGTSATPLGYNLDGWASVQHAMFRIRDSDYWIVGRWNYLDLSNRFDLEPVSGRLGDLDRSKRASGLGLSLEADTRDNIFTPSRGWTGSIDLTWYDPKWGSDTNFQTYRAHVFGYLPVGRSLVLAGRADARSADGRVPFYMLPFVDLRGVPAVRLQDRHTAVLEAEARWNVDARWALVGFFGGGRAWGRNGNFSEGADAFTKGVGFRYLIARRLGIYAGIDWAWSNLDRAWYIQVGSAWR
ncbi:BamA/TamA family outer membrane protein [Ramlibacter monticola]|uniref:BamA/TamA family outer membrane protein n=1 Tax=Ramlibacter monticola TaxID=1926872 RepID=A0A936Z592_9BURK|nr:BamA/TamA family outer membrane protein [Ramlibacter monticola]MBL0394572.1 BamA/TamA family outer membrane protein [Ramlibacter monticola]